MGKSPRVLPVTPPDVRGVLVIAGPGLRFRLSRFQRPTTKRRDLRVEWVDDACRLLMRQKYDMIIVLPGAVSTDNKESITLLTDLANGSPVLIVSHAETPMTVNPQAEDLEQEVPGLDDSSIGRCQYPTVVMGPINGDSDSGVITAHGKLLKVSRTQSRIMWRLLASPDNKCTAAELVREMPNPDSDGALKTLRVLIYRIRKNLAEVGLGGMLHTVEGGYYLRLPPAPTAKPLGE